MMAATRLLTNPSTADIALAGGCAARTGKDFA
jgi:hypothetical protein